MDKAAAAAIEALAKQLQANQKALLAVPDVPSGGFTGLQPAEQKILDLTKDKVGKVAKDYAEIEKDIQEMEKEVMAAMAKALADCKAAADKATKAYMDAIKNTDGLTSAKPSIVKVLQATGKMPDPAAIEKAVTELGKHRDEMAKTYGKDKEKAKMLASFTKDLETAAKALGGLL